MSAHSAIVGGILAFLAQRGQSENSGWIILFLIWTTVVGFLLTIRWSEAFDSLREKVNAIILSMNLAIVKDEKGNIVDLTMNVPAGRFFRIFRTKRLFYAYYCGMLVALVLYFGAVRGYITIGLCPKI